MLAELLLTPHPTQAPLPLIQKVMEEAATQPSTQPFADPRREGTTSMVNEEDQADILCILLPSSGPALKAVELIAKTSPQHILQNDHVDEIEDIEYDLTYEEEGMMAQQTEQGMGDNASEMAPPTRPVRLTRTKTEEAPHSDTFKMPPPPKPSEPPSNCRLSRDIALRMSSKLHNPCLGFTFGRNPKKSDLLLTTDDIMRLSNCHFRIFLNKNGVLMLEDTSTNGTIVDRTLLTRNKQKNSAAQHTRTLNNGGIIELPIVANPDEEAIRFIVRFPSREHRQDEYNTRLSQYLAYVQQAERQMQVAAKKHAGTLMPFVLPFKPGKDQANASPNASMLAAATGDNSHGLGWNGGEKYNVIKPIGKGAFAMVFQLSTKDHGELYACKQIEKRRWIKDGILNHKSHNEIDVMRDLQHPHIVRFIEHVETRNYLLIIMEFVHFGDLSCYTDNHTAMTEYMCQVMAGQILSALQYLHERQITHRDIKPDNILLANHNPLNFKLSDFGLSKIVRNDETFLKSFCGTLLYCAPEIYPGFQRAKIGLHPSKRTRSWEP